MFGVKSVSAIAELLVSYNCVGQVEGSLPATATKPARFVQSFRYDANL